MSLSLEIAPSVEAATRPVRRYGYAAAVWGSVFAVPSFVWALGYSFGASSTVSPSLVKLAQERNPGFVAVLVVTGLLKLVGALLGLALVRRLPWGRGMNRLLQLMAWGAGVLLVWHGVLFVGMGMLVQVHVIKITPDLLSISRWYTYLWGPWFVAGGVAFMLAARTHLRGLPDQRAARIAGVIGGLGALLLSVMALVGGLG